MGEHSQEELGYHVNGHGSAVGSRKQPGRKIPAWDKKYLASPEWQAQKQKHDWIGFWKKCSMCSSGHKLEVHHNCYDRLGHEDFTDCTVVCHSCHSRFHDISEPPDENPVQKTPPKKPLSPESVKSLFSMNPGEELIL